MKIAVVCLFAVLSLSASASRTVRVCRGGGFAVSEPDVVFTPQLFLKGWQMRGGGGSTSVAVSPDGTVAAEYVCTNAVEREIETFNLCARLDLVEWIGAKFSDGERDLVLPEKFVSLTPFSGKTRAFTVRPRDGGAALRFEFAAPVDWTLQDNREFGGTVFELRFNVRQRGTFAAGEVVRLPFRMVSVEPLALCATQGYPVKQSAEWIPVRGGGEIAPGSALDFSRFVPSAPCGTHGRVVARNGHFEFEKLPGVPQRFCGANLTFGANFPDAKTAREVARRFRRVGYNAVRFHHHDGGLVEGSADGTTINPERLAKLDALVAAFAAEGVWASTDLFVSRAVPWRQIGVDRPGCVPMDEFKAVVRTNSAARANLKAFVRQWFDHVNPHTGRRWADDPALAWISLVNENSPVRMGVTVDRAMAEKQLEFMRDMRSFLRDELNCRALVTDMNDGWASAPEFKFVRDDPAFDFVDNHYYVDHPRFLEKPWRLPSDCHNHNPVGLPDDGIASVSKVRAAGKPFAVSEWHFTAPGKFRSSAGLIVGATAVRQDWDALWRFAWGGSEGDLAVPCKRPISYFIIPHDPLALATERATFMLFMRDDLAAAGSKVRFDDKAGSIVVNTPRTAGFFGEGGVLDAGSVRARLDSVAALWASSLDGKPIPSSGRILVTHVTDAQNSNCQFDDPKRSVLLSWGELPVLMRAGKAETSIAAAPGKWRVWALASDGARRGEIPCARDSSGRLSFVCDVARDPAEATWLYELEKLQ